MSPEEKLITLENLLVTLYQAQQQKLLFHGWHHIIFVRDKAREFALAIEADIFLTESAALVHDLNYITKPNSHPVDGASLRQEYLTKAGYTEDEQSQIEAIILEAHTADRGTTISLEGQALSDADTLFKALPITPIVFASKYIEENHVDIANLAEKVCLEQNKLMEQGIYFYTQQAKRRYLPWAKTNLELWNNVRDSLRDPAVAAMLKLAER